jgi:hypothetical protein
MPNEMRMPGSMSKEMDPAKGMLYAVHSFDPDHIRLMTVRVRLPRQAIRERVRVERALPIRLMRLMQGCCALNPRCRRKGEL